MAIDFRIYSDFCRNKKTKKLRRTLGDSGFFCLVQLWCTASEQYPSGVFEHCDADDIEIMSDWQGEAGVFVKTLTTIGFLDFDGTTYTLHDWQDKNPYVAQSENRRAAGRLNVLKRYNPSMYEYYKSIDRTGITERELQEAKVAKNPETFIQKASNSLVTDSKLASKASNESSNGSKTTRATIVGDSKASSPYPYPYPYPKTESNNIYNNIYTTATTEGGMGETKPPSQSSDCSPSDDGTAEVAAETPVSVPECNSVSLHGEDLPETSANDCEDEFDLKPQGSENKKSRGGVYTCAEAVRWWNKHMVAAGFTPVSAVTETRKRKFRLRQKFFKDAGAYGRAFWEEVVFPRLKRSKFIREKPNLNTLDWLLKGDEHIVRLNEGLYDDREEEAWS